MIYCEACGFFRYPYSVAADKVCPVCGQVLKVRGKMEES